MTGRCTGTHIWRQEFDRPGFRKEEFITEELAKRGSIVASYCGCVVKSIPGTDAIYNPSCVITSHASSHYKSWFDTFKPSALALMRLSLYKYTTMRIRPLSPWNQPKSLLYKYTLQKRQLFCHIWIVTH